MAQPSSESNYPTVGERLGIQHNDHHQISIETEIIEFRHLELAICRSRVTTTKGIFTGSGVASQEKDADMVTSLLEIAETRAVSRALRFSGALVEYTGREEMPKPTSYKPIPSGSISNGQKKAIEDMAKDKGWNVIQAVRRILGNNSIEELDHLNKQEASAVIQRMRSALVA